MRENISEIHNLLLKLCIFVNLLTLIYSFDAKSFDDTVLFKFNWPGKEGFDALDLDAFETLLVTTKDNEKYQCLLPQNLEKEKESADVYDGPTALELLSPLFTQSSCIYRLESYWTYELCHGRHIRQYHEERDAKQPKTQEYFLGKWDKKLYADLKEKVAKEDKNTPLPIKKIDGMTLPYFQIIMTDGTLCDLNGNLRSTKIQYVCYIHGKNEIYSLKESSTCEYEVVVLSPFLCQHPDYRPHETGEHPINCLPVDGAPKKPKELLSMEAESLKLRHQRQSDEFEVNAELLWQDEKQKMYAVFSIDRDGDLQDGEARVRVEIHPIDIMADADIATGGDDPSPAGPPTPPAKPWSRDPVFSFLSGKNCLTGGSGWWKYEFCYGRSVAQYHEEKDGTRTSIELGRFNVEKHKEWIEQNPHKRPRPMHQRTQISHFYSDGSFCEKAEKPRQVEVKLKCVDGSISGSAVALYLLEPKVCEYLLGIESPALCEFVIHADNDGLFPDMMSPDQNIIEEKLLEILGDEEEIVVEAQSAEKTEEDDPKTHKHPEL